LIGVAIVISLLKRGFNNPWLMISMTCLFWAGNVVAARTAIGEISPLMLTSGRWMIACAILLLIAHRQLRADWPSLAPHWLRIFLMGAGGFTVFHALYYLSAHYTSGVNLSIMPGASPVLVLIGAWMLWRTRVTWLQGIGCALTIVGILIVGTHGDVNELIDLKFNIGDIGMFVASIMYAAYTLSLRNRPKASPIGFFIVMALAALIASIPGVIWEWARGELIVPTTTKGLMILLYTALFPSLMAQIFYIRSIELIGPNRAILFYNLTPVISAVLSTLFLNEPFQLYHALALVFVVGGVMIAEKLGRPQ
jgi:drug/metabolite transporter (DMT)-like permease